MSNNRLLGLSESTANTVVESISDNKDNNGLGANGLNYFKAYDSQLSIPETKGTRVIKCLYQVNTKTGKKIAENSYIRVPTNHINEAGINERMDEIMPYIIGLFLDKEEAIIKESHKNGILNIHNDSLSIDKILEYMEANETSGRLNKESIEAWFEEEIKDNLIDLFAAKMGLDNESSEAEMHKLEQVIAAYKLMLSSLASPKILAKEETSALINVIEKADSNKSSLGIRLIKKMEMMHKKAKVALMSL
jgi:hypothetical protein